MAYKRIFFLASQKILRLLGRLAVLCTDTVDVYGAPLKVKAEGACSCHCTYIKGCEWPN